MMLPMRRNDLADRNKNRGADQRAQQRARTADDRLAKYFPGDRFDRGNAVES